MIKLSDMLAATLDDKDPLIALQINEVKRLEALDVPRVDTGRKPLVDRHGDNLCVILDDSGNYVDYEFSIREAECNARDRTFDTGQPHTVCQVMAPESGECPTIPVATFTPTPERPHEWVVFLHRCHLLVHRDGEETVFIDSAKRFPTATEAQDYIDTHKIAGAYPWPVPKLTS